MEFYYWQTFVMCECIQLLDSPFSSLSVNQFEFFVHFGAIVVYSKSVNILEKRRKKQLKRSIHANVTQLYFPINRGIVYTVVCCRNNVCMHNKIKDLFNKTLYKQHKMYQKHGDKSQKWETLDISSSNWRLMQSNEFAIMQRLQNGLIFYNQQNWKNIFKKSFNDKNLFSNQNHQYWIKKITLIFISA